MVDLVFPGVTEIVTWCSSPGGSAARAGAKILVASKNQDYKETIGKAIDDSGPVNDLTFDRGYSRTNGSALLPIGNTPSLSGGCEVTGESSARNLDVVNLLVSETAKGNLAPSSSVGTGT